MVVGMTTNFAILLIVIYLGKGLIVLVNKYAPEEIIAKKPVAAAVRVQTATPTQTTAIGSLSGQETAAIVSAISAVTRGQGKVIKIEKVYIIHINIMKREIKFSLVFRDM